MGIPLLLISFIPTLSWADDNQSTASASPAGLQEIDARINAPVFIENDIFGKAAVTLNSYRGEVVVLNFWATWCPPCRAEIPALESLQASHKGKMMVIGVSVYSSNRDTEQFYSEDKVNYPMIYGSYELMAKYGRVETIPTTFLIDKKGRIAATIIGSRSAGQYEEMLKPLLSE